METTTATKSAPKTSKHAAAKAHAEHEVACRHVDPSELPADAESLRTLYTRIRGIAPMTAAEFNAAAKAALKGEATPAGWVKAALRVQTECDKCRGSGIYGWGACVNGKMTHSGVCFACGGKGYQRHADWVRNWAYWAFFAHIAVG